MSRPNGRPRGRPKNVFELGVCRRGHPLIGTNIKQRKNGEHYCAACHALASKRWKLEHSERVAESARRCAGKRQLAQRMALYGKTAADWEPLWKESGGVCAICKEAKKLVIDHCHSTGEIRGLLCRSCNSRVGFIETGWSLLAETLLYIKAHAPG